MEKYIDFNTIDLIHSNISAVDFGCILANKHNIKHIMHIREFGQKDFKMKSYRIGYIDYLNECTNMFIAISEAIKDEWINKGIDKKKIVVVYNGIKTDNIKVKNEHKVEGKMRMIITGSLCEGKGQKRLLEAIVKLPDDIKSNIELDIAGEGVADYKQDLIDYVDNNKLNKCVNFIGYCNNVRDKICEYDIGMMCSKAEGFGRVTVEYMTAGICVIASNSGANVEIVDDGKTGFIYDEKDKEAITNKIIYVYQNRNLLQEIGENARKKVFENFITDINSENVFEKYITVLEENANV